LVGIRVPHQKLHQKTLLLDQNTTEDLEASVTKTTACRFPINLSPPE